MVPLSSEGQETFPSGDTLARDFLEKYSTCRSSLYVTVPARRKYTVKFMRSGVEHSDQNSGCHFKRRGLRFLWGHSAFP